MDANTYTHESGGSAEERGWLPELPHQFELQLPNTMSQFRHFQKAKTRSAGARFSTSSVSSIAGESARIFRHASSKEVRVQGAHHALRK
eukprot:452104-Rhodomonas_salina.5